MLKALRAEREEAGRVWVKAYSEATSDKNEPNWTEPPPTGFSSRGSWSWHAVMPDNRPRWRPYSGWLKCANARPVFDEGLALIEQHHIEDEGIAKMCRTLVHRRTPGIERFLLAVAEKHPNRDVQGLAYLSLARLPEALLRFCRIRA